MKKILIITNSCGRKGCDTDRIILPNDGKFGSINSRVFQTDDDTTWLLCLGRIALEGRLQDEQREIIKQISSGTWAL